MDGWKDINCAELREQPQILALESSLEILSENSYFCNKTRKQSPSKHWMLYSSLCPQVHLLWEEPRLPSFWAKEQTNSNRSVSRQRWTLAWKTPGSPGRTKHPQVMMCFKSIKHASLNTNPWFISSWSASYWVFLSKKKRFSEEKKGTFYKINSKQVYEESALGEPPTLQRQFASLLASLQLYYRASRGRPKYS